MNDLIVVQFFLCLSPANSLDRFPHNETNTVVEEQLIECVLFDAEHISHVCVKRIVSFDEVNDRTISDQCFNIRISLYRITNNIC